MIANIMTNKKFSAIIKELFIICRELNISVVFITQSYFSVPKDVGLNSTHFVKIYRECKKILTTDTTLPASDPPRFRKKMFYPYKNDSN